MAVNSEEWIKIWLGEQLTPVDNCWKVKKFLPSIKTISTKIEFSFSNVVY